MLRFVWQMPLCNLCTEVYNKTKAEGVLSVFAVALLAEGVDRNVVPSGITLEQWEAVCEAVQEERNSIMTARRYDFGSYEENIQHVIIDETCRRLGVKCYRREARK